MFSIGLMIVSIVFPVVVVVVLLKYYKKLNTENIKIRIGSLYENLRIERRAALMFNALFVTRRLIYASLIVLMKETPGLQTMILF